MDTDDTDDTVHLNAEMDAQTVEERLRRALNVSDRVREGIINLGGIRPRGKSIMAAVLAQEALRIEAEKRLVGNRPDSVIIDEYGDLEFLRNNKPINLGRRADKQEIRARKAERKAARRAKGKG